VRALSEPWSNKERKRKKEKERGEGDDDEANRQFIALLKTSSRRASAAGKK